MISLWKPLLSRLQAGKGILQVDFEINEFSTLLYRYGLHHSYPNHHNTKYTESVPSYKYHQNPNCMTHSSCFTKARALKREIRLTVYSMHSYQKQCYKSVILFKK